MITLKIFLQAVIIFQLNSFSNADDNSKIRAVQKQNVRGSLRYGYNHPPSVEIYQPIPVAVLYEDVSIREDKSYEVPSKSSTTKKPKVVTTTVAEKATTITTTTVNDNENSQTESINIDIVTKVPQLKLSANFYTEEQIPVAIVYEEPIKINYRKVNNQRQNSIRQRPEKVETEVNETNNILSTSEANKTILTKELKNEVGETTHLTSNASSNSKRRKLQRSKPVSQVNPNVDSKRKLIPDQTINNVQQNTNSQNNKTNQEKVNILNHDININTTTKNKTRERDPVVPIIESENHVYQNGVFKYSYESGDGTKVFSQGELKSVVDENTGESVIGGFSYKGKEGNDYSLTYTADENGYRPVGAHLPTPPPIPPAIARALAYLATITTSEPVTESIDEQN